MIACMASSEYYNHICDFDNYMDKDNNRVSMDKNIYVAIKSENK